MTDLPKRLFKSLNFLKFFSNVNEPSRILEHLFEINKIFEILKHVKSFAHTLDTHLPKIFKCEKTNDHVQHFYFCANADR